MSVCACCMWPQLNFIARAYFGAKLISIFTATAAATAADAVR